MTSLFDHIMNMLHDHWFWGVITLACLVWYSTITVYVAWKGAKDIKNMLKRLEDTHRESQS